MVLFKLILTFLLFSSAIAQGQAEFTLDPEYVSTRKVEVCTIPLPVTSHIRINRMIFNTKHIYLRVDGKTFGTPFTTKGTYFGGDAHLYSEDILFVRTKGEGEECFPTYFHQNDLEEEYSQKLHCIASKMSYPEKEEREGRIWYPVFDYHVWKNNCGSMANYIVECAGGKIQKKWNFSVGDMVEPSKDAKIITLDSDYETTLQSNYGEICQKALEECL